MRWTVPSRSHLFTLVSCLIPHCPPPPFLPSLLPQNHLPRNYSLFWHHPYINRIVNQIAAAMKWDYDAVHVRRGDKLNPRLWPHLDNDTRPEA